MASLSVHESLDAPFSTATAASVDDPGYPVSVDGRPYLLDLNSDQFSRRSVQLLNTQQAQSGGDVALLTPMVWRRSTDSWHQGSGQARYDREESLPYRFHESDGIDPWSRFGFSLLHDTTLIRDLTGSSATLLALQESLFVGQGTTVAYYATLGASPTNHTTPATILSMTTDGENVYVLCANGVIEKRDSLGAWTTYYTVASFDPNRSFIAYVKDFLIVGNKNILLNINNPGAVVTIYTHPLSAYTWRTATDGQVAIYLLGGAGDRWNIHRMSIANTGATLDPPIVAATLPDGEIAYALGTYLGYLLIGVHYGWRFATTDSSGEVTFGRIVQTSEPVRCFEGQDRFVWFGLSRTDATPATRMVGSKAGIGRADLSTFVESLTPASATDLISSGYGTVTSIVTVGGATAGMGKRVFAVSGVGVFTEADALRSEGTISLGAYNFNSTDQKMGLYAQVFHEPLVGGSVAVEMLNDINSPDFVEVGRNSAEGSVSVGNVSYARPFNTAEIQIRLARSASDATQGPRVNRVEFRAIDIPGRATEWRIPLLLAEEIEVGGAIQGRNVPADYDSLVNLVQSRRRFTYREGVRTYELHAVDFVWQPHKQTQDSKTFTGTFVLVAQELT